MTLMEVNEPPRIIQEAAHEDANIIFGAVSIPSPPADQDHRHRTGFESQG